MKPNRPDKFLNCVFNSKDTILLSTKYNFYVVDKKLKLLQWIQVPNIKVYPKLWQVTYCTLDASTKGFLIAGGIKAEDNEEEEELSELEPIKVDCALEFPSSI